jgi:hypothetical protein
VKTIVAGLLEPIYLKNLKSLKILVLFFQKASVVLTKNLIL